MYDAEGSRDGTPCPRCGNEDTISWRFEEGFDELECPRCGYRSDAEELEALERHVGDVLRKDDDDTPPPTKRPLKA